uniref:Putative secreted protein n=1 Tax=Anopheles darlingi TaxID=43151 RepID=A0A2M4D3S6_ANODA
MQRRVRRTILINCIFSVIRRALLQTPVRYASHPLSSTLHTHKHSRAHIPPNQRGEVYYSLTLSYTSSSNPLNHKKPLSMSVSKCRGE